MLSGVALIVMVTEVEQDIDAAWRHDAVKIRARVAMFGAAFVGFVHDARGTTAAPDACRV
ncbi:hypothetical protein DIE21_01680 [Burkholderia sp. Bp9140]|nr:hypothetical protein DIE21_01680 [Burkholderia sp. Bp9140]